jgi:hypothetical protein
VVSEREHQE